MSHETALNDITNALRKVIPLAEYGLTMVASNDKSRPTLQMAIQEAKDALTNHMLWGNKFSQGSAVRVRRRRCSV